MTYMRQIALISAENLSVEIKYVFNCSNKILVERRFEESWEFVVLLLNYSLMYTWNSFMRDKYEFCSTYLSINHINSFLCIKLNSTLSSNFPAAVFWGNYFFSIYWKITHLLNPNPRNLSLKYRRKIWTYIQDFFITIFIKQK